MAGTPVSQIPQGFQGATPYQAGNQAYGHIAFNTPVVNGRQQFDPRFATYTPAMNQSQGIPMQGYANSAYAQNPAAYSSRGASPLLQQGQQQQTPQQPQATQQGGQNGTPFNVQTGITQGPVLPQQLVQSEQDRLRNFRAPMPDGAGRDYAPFMERMNAMLGQQMNTAATDFGRDAAYANAQQMLGSQRANASAGTGWANIGLGEQATQMNEQSRVLQMILSMLGQVA